MKKLSERPFELFGMSFADYSSWCDENGLNKNKRESRKEFFKLAISQVLIKKDGVLIDARKGKNNAENDN